ncbi:uncharacterized protein LOC114933352 [Nylanderia fulva]|uniref:uncharacterized protein LOC114933352 n=1 Tax=Nylanderia fulva TaxID=613905 RepID=UPI0010FB0E89|nr:uncharacterized protein LOC114933352 [Nylanderia fulva]
MDHRFRSLRIFIVFLEKAGASGLYPLEPGVIFTTMDHRFRSLRIFIVFLEKAGAPGLYSVEPGVIFMAMDHQFRNLRIFGVFSVLLISCASLTASAESCASFD